MTYYATSSGHLSRRATCSTSVFLSRPIHSYRNKCLLIFKIQTFPNIAPQGCSCWAGRNVRCYCNPQLRRREAPRSRASWSQPRVLAISDSCVFSRSSSAAQHATGWRERRASQMSVALCAASIHSRTDPPSNDFAGMRFVTGTPDPVSLRDSRSPNYVQIGADGSMATVAATHHRSSRRTSRRAARTTTGA